MMKKNVFLVAALCLISALYAEETDLTLFNGLSAAYNSGFYPGAAEYASRLEAAYPDSVYSGRALVIEGESLVRLGRSSDAEKALAKAQTLIEKDQPLMHACFYWKGRAQYAQQNYSSAVLSFFDSCKTSGTGGVYYNSAVLYGGRSYYALGQYQRATAPFRYVVVNGEKFPQSDYEEAVLKLADSYNKTSSYKQTAELYGSFTQDSLTPDVYSLFSLYAGDAYNGLNQYRKAFDVYSAVLGAGHKKFAAAALQKAYAVSSEHRNEVGTDAGTVLAQAQSALADSPGFVSEFWVRLGIDAYNRNDFIKAEQYFDSSGSNAADPVKQTMALYRAEIIFSKTGAAKAASYLEQAEENAHLEEGDTVYSEYASLMITYASLQGKWEDVKSYAAKIPNPDQKTLYYTAFAYYSLNDYDTALTIVNKMIRDDSDAPMLVLYVRLLLKTQKTADALSVFERLEKSGKMDDTSRLDYAQTLLLAGKLSSAYDQAVKSRAPDALYVAGLASFNSREWKKAGDSFAQYRRISSGSGKFQQYALFYLGYAQYRIGQSSDAYSSLADFAAKYPENELCWNARITAANAAVQSGKYEQAAMQAEEAVRTASDSRSREKAVLLCSGIYADAGNYAEAVNILSPYTMQKSPFGMKSLYETAQIFVKQGEIEKADDAYQKIVINFPSGELTEESMYRRGEIYYTIKQYKTALDRFSGYEKLYPEGRFTDAVWYFSADCQIQQGNTTRAVLLNNALIKKYPDSTYIYGAMKSLMAVYRQTGDYTDALAQAQGLVQKFGSQARSDGIARQAAELEKLASGSNEVIVHKQSEYEQKGRLTTSEGRRAGTELASLYASSESTLSKASDLAQQLLSAEKAHLDTEGIDAAANAVTAGLYSRRTEKNKEAADFYLFAAEQYRKNGKDDDAAASLYNAADAFRAAGRDADADETVKTLKQLYPASRQSKSIDKTGW